MFRQLNKVVLSADVYAVCIQHALSTEKEEIMGLLIGEVDDSNISYISAGLILHRSEKKSDRVEISAEQLCMASTHAEQLAEKLGRPMRVLGWYHSHPHITVWPSHVDLRTQAMYQIMDPLFVGLIFSVFLSENNVGNQVQLTCFQATDNYERRDVNIVIEKVPLRDYNLKNICELPKILIQEEVEIHNTKCSKNDDILVNIHNEAFKTLSLSHLITKISQPICEDLEARLEVTNLRIKELEKMLIELKRKSDEDKI
ncbi:lys-63-specific deubiquitinase BRCC36-like [Onthophagus taurus]|uniref:lys-63-specific deubiquitinase BRCC36-like n=1 Tax=Onthophagus taurus TaxID=166361 RepID=UPI000C208158|nr:lys-63-specific deubiquitinase BRCC36-like [Onthophagus taurus]